MHKPSHRRNRRRQVAVGAGLVIAAAVAIVLAMVWSPGHSGSQQDSAGVRSQSTPSTRTRSAPAITAAPTTGRVAVATTVATIPAVHKPAPAVPKPAAPATTPAVTTSSCQSVVHIGDSTSESLVSADYLPNPALRLNARYTAVGAVHQNLQISGARSIVETYEGEPNAYTVAAQIAATGYQGCWVVAMGVNDAADIAVGSRVSAPERIERMMSVIGNQPVLWIAVRTLVPGGPYAESNMAAWNSALLDACASHPHMRVLNWAAEASPTYYIPDGIHYNTPGSAVLAAAFAHGLAAAFPGSGASPRSCLVT